jgi:hypothetical protein
MHNRGSRLFVIVAIVAVAWACSGKTATTTSAPSASSGGTSSGSSGNATVGCPDTAPWTRTTASGPKNPCSKEGQICEYGTDFDPRCNTLVQCTDGEWGVPILYGGGSSPPKCGSSGPPVSNNPADCPASAPPNDLACASTSTCGYDGATCACGHYCPSYPIEPPPCDPDAGRTTNCCDRSGPTTWHCFGGPTYCPSPRPHVGDPCTNEGDSCAISPPAECDELTLTCRSGTWQMPNTTCPVSTARAKRDIAYLGPGEAARLRDGLLQVKLATYKYKGTDPSTHLGFVIEDMPQGSPAVLASRERVDLYGYVSMAVAAIQEQQREIDDLRRELARCR